jgi:serine/threonine protein phosphatase PrpC
LHSPPSTVNQDRYVIKYAIGEDPGVSLWGVMDGHGEYGHYVAAFVQENLPICLSAEKGLRKDPEAAITRATAAMCKRLNDTDINCAFSGSTLVYGVKIDDTLYVANVGDSRAVLARQGPNGVVQAIALSNDQKPERPDEKARIIAHGGRVEPLPGPPGECGPARVWLAEADVPGLAMSRSIGDEVSQTVGVISVPEITVHKIKDEDVLVVWASDGVWEFISDDQAIKLVWKHKDNLAEAAAQLAEESTKQWRKEEEVIDDITCVIVQFNAPK